MRVIVEPFLDPASRTYWVWALTFLALALPLAGRQAWSALVRPFWHRSSVLDVQLLLGRQLLRGLGLLPTTGAAFGVAAAVSGGLGALGPTPLVLPGWLATLVYSVVLFVAWDLSRFVVHRWMHRSPWLWTFHQVHHSAEVLTPLTFHRVHPVESALYTLRGILVTGTVAGFFHWLAPGVTPWTLFGVAGSGVVLNAVFGNLRHSQVHLGFGPLERWLISPAQHQLHHARDGERCNDGTWLAVWDRLAGTWRPSSEPVGAFGLSAPNHGHDLLSAWLGPVAEAVAQVFHRPTPAVVEDAEERTTFRGRLRSTPRLDRSPPAP